MGRSVLLGLLIGTLAMASFLVLVLLADGAPSSSPIATLFALGFMSVAMGGVPGTLIGVVVGAVKKSRRPAYPLPPPAYPPPAYPLPVAQPVPPPVATDRWAALVARAELSVGRVHSVVATVPPSSARDWMERIAAQFDGELVNLRRIADLGRALEAEREHPVTQRLHTAVADFTAFEDEVGRIALKMVDRTSLDSVRVDLEVLEQQLPQLGGTA